MTEEKPYLNEVVRRLRDNLPAERQYHSAHHTADEVLPAAEQLAGMLGITGEQKRLLLTAAAFHDTGYMNGPDKGHEERSIEIAQELLPSYGYTPSQIEEVACIIRATKWPQQPRNLVEQVMADADLAMVGLPWDKFTARQNQLRVELEAIDGIDFTDIEWYEEQLDFISSHSFFTDAAHALFDEQKDRNIATMRKYLEEWKAAKPSGAPDSES
jgi:predicted metal-dependent HD superfamily phosphohydrolase